jgi:MFS-type transporter involved in bile tolerance (Atg22 family)
MESARRRLSERFSRRLGVNPVTFYVGVVALEALVGWFLMGKYLDAKLGWSFTQILIVVLVVAVAFECLYEFILAGDNVGRRSGGQ